MTSSAVPGPNRNAQLFAPLLLLLSSPVSAAPQELITAADILNLEAPAPDARISYGEGPLQFGHLRLPEADGPHPVITSGVFQDIANGVDHLRELAEVAISPPHEQAEELVDVLKMFVQADSHVSKEEELVLEEISGMVMKYVGRSESGEMYEVVIVPQSDDQIDAVQSLLPGIEPKNARGGKVFSAGQFFSGRYAEVVCDKYIALGLFTATMAVGAPE